MTDRTTMERVKRRRWFYLGTFSVRLNFLSFRKWGNGRRGPWVYGARMANAYYLHIVCVTFQWPLPWNAMVRDLPGYGIEYPSSEPKP